MRRYFRTLRRVLAVALVGGIGGAAAVAQTQYPQTSGYQPTQQPTYPAYQPTPTYQPAPTYPAYPSTAAAPVQSAPAQHTYAPAYVAPGPYAAQQPVGPTYPYPRMAMSKPTPPQPNELPMPSEAVVPEAPKMEDAKLYPSTGNAATGDCNCNKGANTWNNYMAPGGSYGACDSGCDVDVSAPVPCRQWFFGVYGLFMERSDPDRVKLTASVDSPASYPYYPPDDRTILWSSAADPDWQWGAEVRFGSTFGCGSAGDCQCQQPFAWEVGYWGLAEDDNVFTTWDDLGDSDRYYGMVNFAGIEYDRDGSGGGGFDYRPVNDYYDYQMPIEDPAAPGTNEIRVLAQRVRQSFSVQNVEINFVRFPLCNYGVCCGGCDDGCNSCGPSCPRFSMNGLCGVRYMRLDDDFQYGTFFTNFPTNPGDPQSYPGGMPLDDDNVLLYDISIDNELVGFQLGSNMCWNITCRCAAFWDTTFGLYNNHISQYQRLYNESGGMVRFQGSGENFAVRSSDDDIAFIGETRLGLGYQVSCNCRLTAAYRVIGIGGLATAIGQIPTDFSSAEYVSYINANDSIILHGLQFGTEFKY